MNVINNSTISRMDLVRPVSIYTVELGVDKLYEAIAADLIHHSLKRPSRKLPFGSVHLRMVTVAFLLGLGEVDVCKRNGERWCE